MAFIQKKISRFLSFCKFTVLHGTGSAFRIGSLIQLANRMQMWIRNTAHEHIFFSLYGIPAIFLTRFPDGFVFLIAPFSLVFVSCHSIYYSVHSKLLKQTGKNLLPDLSFLLHFLVPGTVFRIRFRFLCWSPHMNTVPSGSGSATLSATHAFSPVIDHFNSPAVTSGWQKYADLHEVRVRLYP